MTPTVELLNYLTIRKAVISRIFSVFRDLCCNAWAPPWSWQSCPPWLPWPLPPRPLLSCHTLIPEDPRARRQSLFSQSVITINVPVLAVWKSRLFWALKWQQAKRVPFGPKKRVGTENRDFFGPWNGNERNGCCPHQNNYVQRHINNRYINSSSINTVVNWLTQWQSNDQETRRKVWRRRY